MEINWTFTFTMSNSFKQRSLVKMQRMSETWPPHCATIRPLTVSVCVFPWLHLHFSKAGWNVTLKPPHPTLLSLKNLANSAHVSVTPNCDLPICACYLHFNKLTANPLPAKTCCFFFLFFVGIMSQPRLRCFCTASTCVAWLASVGLLQSLVIDRGSD